MTAFNVWVLAEPTRLLSGGVPANNVGSPFAAFCARAIADRYAVFPRLRLVFCSNRKTAAEWTRNYFSAVWAVHDRLDEGTLSYPPDSGEALASGREV